jgi:hypothetical protein
MAEDNDIANSDIGPYARIGTDGQAALREGYGSFDISVDVEVFTAGELSPDDDRLTDDGGTLGWLHMFSVLPWSCLLRLGLARTIPKLMPRGNLLNFGKVPESYVRWAEWVEDAGEVWGRKQLRKESIDLFHPVNFD